MKCDSIPLKRLAKVIAGQSPDSKDVLDLNGGTPFIQGNAEFGKIHPSPRLECAVTPKIAHDMDILVSVRAPVGAVNVANRTLGIGRGVAAVRPTHQHHARFLYWSLLNSEKLLNSVATGSTFAAISGDDLGSLPIALPGNPSEVADYLDHETAEIDALIDEHQQLADLVHERTESHVNLTIAGNPSTRAMDSNNLWIGQIPSHWTAQKLAWIFPTIGSGTTPRTEDIQEYTGSIPWVTSGELRESGISLTRRGVTPKVRRDYSALHIFPPQSILIAMYGATIGRLGWLEVPATVNQAICALSGYGLGPAKYPYYALMAARKHILTLASGGGQPNISQDKVRSLRIPVPPSDEQVSIVKNLDRALDHDALVTGDVSQILALARERRAALITAAVTGQIDVTARNKPAAEQLEDDIAQGLHREN